jgi:hypothetical protein
MMRTRLLSVLWIALSLSGCATAHLQEVRDFAGESTKLSAYSEMSIRFRDTYQREQPYLTPAADRLAKENDAARRAAYGDIVKIERAVADYLQTLGALAGERQFDLSGQIDGFGSAIKAMPMAGIEQRHVTAYTGLARLAAGAITSKYQARSLQAMVRAGDPDLQTMLDAMILLVRYYDKTSSNEKKTILGLLEVEIAFADKPGDRLQATLAKVHQQSKASEFQAIGRRFGLAEKGLSAVAAGHRTLLENLDRIDQAQVRQQIGQFARDLREIRENLSAKPT